VVFASCAVFSVSRTPSDRFIFFRVPFVGPPLPPNLFPPVGKSFFCKFFFWFFVQRFRWFEIHFLLSFYFFPLLLPPSHPPLQGARGIFCSQTYWGFFPSPPELPPITLDPFRVCFPSSIIGDLFFSLFGPGCGFPCYVPPTNCVASLPIRVPRGVIFQLRTPILHPFLLEKKLLFFF